MPAEPHHDEELVRRTAALARLSIDGDEARALARDFARILAAFHALEEVDRADADAGPAPSAAADGAAADGPARRPDEPAPFPDPAALRDAAPDETDGFFGVPKTLGGPE